MDRVKSTLLHGKVRAERRVTLALFCFERAPEVLRLRNEITRVRKEQTQNMCFFLYFPEHSSTCDDPADAVKTIISMYSLSHNLR